jgi:acyl-CoA thioester hydrolase
MGIVHHANHVRYLELARVQWMDEHHRPYREYVADGLHFATTRVELDYQRSAGFDDEIEISTWLERARGASLAMGYVIRRGGERLGGGRTEHALVDGDGRPRRLPPAERAALAALAPPGASGGRLSSG